MSRPEHRAEAVAAHLAYGNRYDPHAAVCSCGWHGRIQFDRSRAENDAENHVLEERHADERRASRPR